MASRFKADRGIIEFYIESTSCHALCSEREKITTAMLLAI